MLSLAVLAVICALLPFQARESEREISDFTFGYRRVASMADSSKDEYQFEILSIETIDGGRAATRALAVGGFGASYANNCQTDDTSSSSTRAALSRLAGPHLVPSSPSSGSAEPGGHVCTCVKHCPRVSSLMDEWQADKQNDIDIGDCDGGGDDHRESNSLQHSDQQQTRDKQVGPPSDINSNHSNQPVDLHVDIKLKRRFASNDHKVNSHCETETNVKCLSVIGTKMVAFLRKENVTCRGHSFKRILFPLILIFSIVALVLLHNGSLRTRKTPHPSKFFTSGNPFISEFELGQLKDLWSRISQNEVSFIMYYAPWDSDSIRARNEFEVVSNHYGGQIFFGAINCWWPDGECRKYQNLRRYPHFVAHIRTEGEVEYKGPILASYIIPFLDNVMNPIVPIQNEGELLDLRAKHDAVVLAYFNFQQSPHQSGYRTYLTTAIKALVNDPWRSVAFSVVTNPRVALKLKINPDRESSLILFVGNSTEHFTAKSSKPTTILSWIYSRASASSTLKWLNPSGIKSTRLSDYIHNNPTLILFTPRSFLLGISPYFDLLREVALDYHNCDNSPVIRSLIHRNILRRRLLEDKLSELEERCHELLDEEVSNMEEEKSRRFNDNEDTCCHSQTVKWRSYGGARRGMTKKCLCTSCVHISLPKCPARCSHFDCLSTASRFLDDFDPNSVNNSAVYCNQIRSFYEPKYTSYYKISTTCSGTLSPLSAADENTQWYDVDRYSSLSSDEKISRMIQDFEIQHCRRLKLATAYTDLNFPDSSENRTSVTWRANFTGLGCRTNQTLKFLALDSSLYPAFAESLGIDVFNVPHSTVAFIIDPKNENVHVLNHEILYKEIELPNYDSKTVVNVPVNSYSKKSFHLFIKDFTQGTLPRFLRSQIVSSSGLCDLTQSISADPSSNSNVICVPELNSVTFTNFVLGKSFDGKDNGTLAQIGSKMINKDILVMYYAPWCGFCTSIAHIYLDVARFYAFSNEILFTRINGDANDLPWEYTVDRYPTIMLFPAKKRSNSLVYSPTQVITKSGLLQFILKHSQLSVRIQTMLAFCKRSCLERSLVSSHSARRSLWRAIRHHAHSLVLNRYETYKVDRKLRLNLSKDAANKLKQRKAQLVKYSNYLLSALRRLRRTEQRQSLLSYFLLLRIDHFRKYSSSDTTHDPYTYELGQELTHQTLHGIPRSAKRQQTDKLPSGEVRNPSKIKANAHVMSPLKKQSVPKRVLRDEL